MRMVHTLVSQVQADDEVAKSIDVHELGRLSTFHPFPERSYVQLEGSIRTWALVGVTLIGTPK